MLVEEMARFPRNRSVSRHCARIWEEEGDAADMFSVGQITGPLPLHINKGREGGPGGGKTGLKNVSKKEGKTSGYIGGRDLARQRRIGGV